jgi:hypothetical protein
MKHLITNLIVPSLNLICLRERKQHHDKDIKHYVASKYNNNNNQAFYSQASWGRLEMKPHEPKNRYKTRVKNKGKTKGDKKPNKKRRQ